MRHSMICMLVSLSLLACGKPGSGGSRGPKPPEPEIRQAQPVTITQSALPGAGKIPVYVRVREPRKTIERIGDWTSATQPTMNAATIEQNLEANGMPISKFQPGENAVIAMWPQPPESKVGGILPLADGTELANLGMQTEPIPGDGLLFGQDSTGQSLAQVKAVRDDLVKIQKSPISSDAELAVDVEALWGVYGPLARVTLPQMIAGMMSSEQESGLQSVLAADANAAMDLLDQIRDTTLRASFDREALEFSFVMRPKSGEAGTTLTQFLNAEPVVAPELTRYVSRNDIVTQITVRDMNSLMNLMYAWMGTMMKPGDIEQLRRQFAGIEKVGTLHSANGFSMSPDSAVTGDYIMVADKPDELMKVIREKMSIANSGPLHEFYMNLDIDVRVSSASLQRDYKGCRVEKWEMTITPGPNAKDIDREMMAKMFPGKVAIEMAQVGGFVTVSLGQPIDALIDRILQPEGRAPSRAVMTFPAGAIFYMDFDIVGYLHGVKKALPDMPQLGAANLPASAPPVLVAAYHQQGQAYYVVKVPRELVKAIGQPEFEDEQTTRTE